MNVTLDHLKIPEKVVNDAWGTMQAGETRQFPHRGRTFRAAMYPSKKSKQRVLIVTRLPVGRSEDFGIVAFAEPGPFTNRLRAISDTQAVRSNGPSEQNTALGTFEVSWRAVGPMKLTMAQAHFKSRSNVPCPELPKGWDWPALKEYRELLKKSSAEGGSPEEMAAAVKKKEELVDLARGDPRFRGAVNYLLAKPYRRLDACVEYLATHESLPSTWQTSQHGGWWDHAVSELLQVAAEKNTNVTIPWTTVRRGFLLPVGKRLVRLPQAVRKACNKQGIPFREHRLGGFTIRTRQPAGR